MLRRIVALLFALVMSVPAFAAPDCSGACTPGDVSWLDTIASDAAQEPTQDAPLDEPPGASPCEGAMDSPALMTVRPDAKAPLLSMSRPHPYAVAAWLAPYLDGPQRPPCAQRVSA